MLSQSHVYLSEALWPHTLGHLAPEINEVRESLVLSPQGSLWDWANEGSMQGLAGGYFEMKDSRDILTVEDPSAREPVAYALLCVLV